MGLFREFITSEKWTTNRFALELLLLVFAAGVVLIALIIFFELNTKLPPV